MPKLQECSKMITDHGQFKRPHYNKCSPVKEIPQLTDDLFIDAHRIGDKPKETVRIIHYKFEKGKLVEEEMELSLYHFEILRRYFDNRTRQIAELAKSVENGTNEKRVWYAGKWHKKQVKEEHSNLPEGVTDEDIG